MRSDTCSLGTDIRATSGYLNFEPFQYPKLTVNLLRRRGLRRLFAASTLLPMASTATRSKTAPVKRRATRDHASSVGEQMDNVTRAYQTLRIVIVSGQLPPGSRISERIVAERLGLSRTPVRSALHRLEQQGFISATGRGRERRLCVAPLTMDDGREVFFIVGHLEGLAARTAALLPASRRREIVKSLREANAELEAESHQRGDGDRCFELDHAFHNHYVDGVVGPRLLALHRAIKPQSDRYSRLYTSVLRDQLATSVKEHEKIVRAIAKGDADTAQRAAETNWHNAAERLTRIIAKQGERGSW